MKSKIISSVCHLDSSQGYSKNNFIIVSKKLFVLALLIVGTTIIAQERNRKHQGNKMEQFTPEQQNQLMLKKMTLELDLTEAQQKEMTAFISGKMAKKEAHKAEMKAMKEKGEKPTADQKYEMKNKMLDEQIVMKSRVQKILTPAQYEKWEKMKQNKKKEYKHKKTQKSKVKEE